MAGPQYIYTANIPQASQAISITQQPIENNFLAINELINVNHVGFYDLDDYGKHTFTSFPLQGSAPTTAAGEMAIFAATSSDANGIELFYRYPSNGTIAQLTGGVTGAGVGANPGYSYISPTVFLMWGTASVTSSSSTTITFPTGSGFPTFTTVLGLYFNAAANYTNFNAAAYIYSSTTTNFVFTVPGANYSSSIYWLAIGQ